MSLPSQSGNVARTLRDVSVALQRLPAPAMLIGGLAVIAHGVPRTTRDVDVAVAGGVIPTSEILATFGEVAIEPRIENAIQFAAKSQVLLLRHRETGVEVDVSLGWLSFELEALDAAEVVSLADVDIPIVRAEDLVVYKTVAWRARDREDIEHLLELHGEHMDLERVRTVVRVLSEALEDPERAAALDSMIAKMRRD